MATMEIHYLIGVLGLISGFLSGLLGIGGGIVMAPLLLYVPPLLGMETLTMQSVAGLTIVQGLAACLSGSLIHKKLRFVSNELSPFIWGGPFLFSQQLAGQAPDLFRTASYSSSLLVGGLVSRLVSVLYLRRLLALLIGNAAVRMWICLFL